MKEITTEQIEKGSKILYEMRLDNDKDVFDILTDENADNIGKNMFKVSRLNATKVKAFVDVFEETKTNDFKEIFEKFTKLISFFL